MCHSAQAQPPLPPDTTQVPPGELVTLTATDGNQLAAWQAQAVAPSGTAVVILPDIRGLFPFYQRLAEYFAAVGVDAVAIDYFGRTAGTALRDAEFDNQPHVRQTTFEGVAADVAAGVAQLRATSRASAIFTVGFCFGGSYSFMQAANEKLGLAGVIGFYGAMRRRSGDGPTPITLAPRARVPVLGLFGGADEAIPPEALAEFQDGLARSGVEHTVHVYPGAPHSFFDRSYADHSAECADAWQRVLGFITVHGPTHTA